MYRDTVLIRKNDLSLLKLATFFLYARGSDIVTKEKNAITIDVIEDFIITISINILIFSITKNTAFDKYPLKI